MDINRMNNNKIDLSVMNGNRMKNRVLQIDKEKIENKADHYFHRICGDPIEGDQKEVYLAEIRKAKAHVLSSLEPKVVCSYYSIDGQSQSIDSCGKVLLEKNKVTFREMSEGINGISFQGGIFNYYNRATVKGVVIYLLTIGNLQKREDMKLLEQYYIDAWGSAYVEAAHDLLKTDLINWFDGGRQSKESCFVSEPFGPGYFSIDVTDTKKIFQLLDHKTLNLTISEGGMMNPEKSCSGFYVIASEDILFPEDHCDSCKASGNCEYCRKMACI